MKYELELSLIGGDAVAEKLSNLRGAISGLTKSGGTKGGAFDIFGGGTEGMEQKSTRVLKSFSILDAWGKSIFKTFRDSAKAMTWFSDAVAKAGKDSAKLEVSPELKKWREEMAARGEPNVHISEANTTNWHDAHIKEWAAQQGMRGSLDPSQVGITDFNSADRLAKEQEDDRVADAIATLRNQRREKQKRQQAQEKIDKDRFHMDMASAALPFFNPLSPWSTLWGSKNIFKGLSTDHGKAFSAKWLGGAGAAGGTAMVVGAATELGLAFKGLQAAINQTVAAYEHARQIYAKSLMSGLGIGFTVKRSMLAEIMGVSEQDIFRFGSQMAYLNPRLEQAAKITAQTTVPLTQVSWEFKILGKDMDSMFSLMAEKAAPAILGITSALDGLVKFLTDHKTLFGNLVSGAASGMGNVVFGPNGNSAISSIMKMFGVIGSAELAANKMPTPQSWMKQLPASHLEHMGLQIAGGTQGPAQETARNTRKMASDISKLVSLFGGRMGQPEGYFGMSPITNNP